METVHRGISEHGDCTQGDHRTWRLYTGGSVNMETIHRGISEHGYCTQGG